MHSLDLAERAQVLAEAMPYLRRYAKKTIVVKFGGHAMVDEESKTHFASDLVLLQQCDIRLVVVHGGGPQIGEMLKRLKIESQFVNGLRVTDSATMDVAEMILSGKINKDIVASIEQKGGRSVGISGRDARTVYAKKLTTDEAGNPVDLGLVGDPETINTALIEHLLAGGFIPVVAPIGVDDEGHSLNINSDRVAGAVAAALNAKRLLMLSDTPGVLDQEGQLIAELSINSARAAISTGIATGGMIPKLQTCLEAVSAGVEASVVLDGRNSHATLIELLSDQGSGTLISDNESA